MHARARAAAARSRSTTVVDGDVALPPLAGLSRRPATPEQAVGQARPRHARRSRRGHRPRAASLDASPTPANALAYLQRLDGDAWTRSARSRSAASTRPTTASSVEPRPCRRARRAARPRDVGRRRRSSQSGVTDAARSTSGSTRTRLRSQGALRRARRAAARPRRSTMELHDFGKPVDDQRRRPATTVVDLSDSDGRG